MPSGSLNVFELTRSLNVLAEEHGVPIVASADVNGSNLAPETVASHVRSTFFIRDILADDEGEGYFYSINAWRTSEGYTYGGWHIEHPIEDLAEFEFYSDLVSNQVYLGKSEDGASDWRVPVWSISIPMPSRRRERPYWAYCGYWTMKIHHQLGNLPPK
jgi:hypothetical protein